MQVPAPAKVNLSLRILRKREDGFHEIETLMAPISLADTLVFEKAPGDSGISLETDDRSLPVGDDNLVVKVARAFFSRRRMEEGVRIRLDKKIPHGAGLGGGSSDAAATLSALNELFGAGLSQQELVECAAELGSDVPFFIYRSAAVCRGRGEIVTPQTLPASLSLLLLKPEFAVATPDAYRKWSHSRELPGYDYAPQHFGGIEYVNDLERPVFEKFPFLAEVKAWLRRQPEVGAALMSGSGSTMMAVLKEQGQGNALAARAKAEIDPRFWTCDCRTVG